MKFKVARVTQAAERDHAYSQVYLTELEPAAIERCVMEGRLMDTDFCFYANSDLRRLVAVGRKDRVRHEAAQQRAARIDALQLQTWHEPLLVDRTEQGHIHDAEELVDLLTTVHSAIRLFFKNKATAEHYPDFAA